ncbi:unnamed protein product [Musa acuminata subsp. malaccensis]|uniref:(wild Malaysian banana) hypothetical protein n=1 Tax=Musa acuminata subsp. malaccensis TaxID=214687 RepID=A0A804JAC2_MUSAM|nr:unnamed protein product [Musa acuminata subsp. malaccensis]
MVREASTRKDGSYPASTEAKAEPSSSTRRNIEERKGARGPSPEASILCFVVGGRRTKREKSDDRETNPRKDFNALSRRHQHEFNPLRLRFL